LDGGNGRIKIPDAVIALGKTFWTSRARIVRRRRKGERSNGGLRLVTGLGFWKIKAADLATNSEIAIASLPKTSGNLFHAEIQKHVWWRRFRNIISGSTLHWRGPSRTKSSDRLKAAIKDAIDKRATTHFDNRTSIHILRLYFNHLLEVVEQWEFNV
jgi:hypothetical protein